MDKFGTCPFRSPIYCTGGHQTCVLGLFNGDKEEIERTCHIEVSKSKLMPLAISLSDGVWAVALERKLDLSQLCQRRPTLNIERLRLWKPLVTSPLNVTLRRLPKLLENIEKIDLHDSGSTRDCRWGDPPDGELDN